MKLKETFFEILPLLILINIFALIYYWLKPDVKFLFYYIPLINILNLIVIFISVLLNIKKIKNQFARLKKTSWILIILIFMIGLFLRAFVVPNTHRLLFDEDIYLNIAQNIVHDGKAVLCNYGTPKHCFEGVLNKQPNGLPVMLSVIYFIFGVSENNASYFMILASSFSILLIFCVVYVWFKNETAALVSALLLALNPISLLFAPTISAESLFVFFSLITIFSLKLILENRNFPSLTFFISSLAFTIQIRPEAPLLVIPLLVFFVKEKIDKKILIGAILFFVLMSPYVFHSKQFINESWGNQEGYKFNNKYALNNLKVNGGFFFDNERFPVLYTLLAFFGMAYMIRKQEFLKLSSMLLWFLSFFIIYLFFYAGSFKYGIDVRFSQTLFIPLFILGGIGAYYIIENFLNKVLKKFYVSFLIIILIIIISFLPFIKFVSAIGEEAWDARTDHDFSVNATKELGENCIIFTHVPSMFLINGNHALQTSYYSNPKILNNIFINYDCVLFHDGYWCVNYKLFKDTVCKSLKQNFNLKVYKNISVRDKTYTLYNMTKK